MDLIVPAITTSFLLLVSFLDLLTKETPYFISFPFLIVGFFSNVVLFFFYPSFFLIINIILAFLISYLKYKFGLWGGGDFLMFLGMSFYLNLTFPYLKFNILYFLFALYLSTLFYNIIYVFFIYFKKNLFSKYELIFIFLLFAFWFINKFFFFFIFLFWILIMIHKLDLLYFTKKVSINNLKEEDWIAYKIYREKEIVLDPKKCREGVDEETIQKLKQLKVEVVYVKEGIPYLPAFFLAYLFLLFSFSPFFASLFPLLSNLLEIIFT